MTPTERVGAALVHLIALVAVLGLTVLLQVLVLIYGWGLSVHSWWWVLGVGVLGQVMLSFLSTIITRSLNAVTRDRPR
jgi:hypothetical protein